MDPNNDVEPLQQVDFGSKDKYFLMRYLQSQQQLARKKSELTVAQRPIFAACPGIRMSMWDGYIASFPLSTIPEIYENIAADIDAETPMHINQIAYCEEGARFAVDFDSTREISVPEIKILVHLLRDTLRDYFTQFQENPIGIFVSQCGPRMKKGHECLSIHMVCHVCLKFKDHLQLLYGFQQRCIASKDIDMEGIKIDFDIYNEKKEAVSMRLIYSSKVETCQVCKKLTVFEQKTCRACDGTRRVRTRHHYIPATHLCGNTNDFANLHATAEMEVANHSIWGLSKEMRLDFAIPQGECVFNYETYKQSLKIMPTERMTSRKRKPENSSYLWLEEVIRKYQYNGSRVWANIQIKQIEVSNNFACVYLDGLGSTFCLYANKDHGTRRFYFRLSSKGELVMRCGSTEYESCKTYYREKDKKISFMLPEELVNAIFGVTGLPDYRKVPKNSTKTKQEIQLERMMEIKERNGF